jgi:hypothetical protein
MANPDTNPAKQASTSHGHGDYERRDIGVAGVVYFLVGLAVFVVIAHFVVTTLYHFLDKQSQAQQTPVSPLVTSTVKDTRNLPPEFKTDAEGTDYEKYLKKSFPTPQLEIDERNQLDKIRINEEDTLSTYDYVDKNAGTVRIPIDRAMELIAQRGLPTRREAGSAAEATPASGRQSKKETKK